MHPVSCDRLAKLPRRARNHAVARVSKVVIVGCRVCRRKYERAMMIHVVEVVTDPGPDVSWTEHCIGLGPFRDDSESFAVGVLAEDVEDFALVLEVRVEAGPRNPARLGDRVDRRARVAAFQKETTTGVQDRRAGAFTAGRVRFRSAGEAEVTVMRRLYMTASS